MTHKKDVFLLIYAVVLGFVVWEAIQYIDRVQGIQEYADNGFNQEVGR